MIDANEDFDVGIDGGARVTVEAPLLSESAALFSVKDRVEGQFRGGERWYPCTVKAVNSDGTYNLSYDDGDEEQRVPPTKIRKVV